VRGWRDVIRRHVDIAHKIADLIVGKNAPDPLRTEAVNAAQYAVRFGTARHADLPYMLRHQTKRAKSAAMRLQKALDRLQKVLADPDLHESLRPDDSGIKAKRLTAWREKAAAFPDPPKAKPLDPDPLKVPASVMARWAATDKAKVKRKRLDVDMLLKVSAAESAYLLLRRFDKKIVMTPGSTFIKTAALLYGKPKANLQNACRIVIDRWSKQKVLSGLPYAAETLLRPYRVADDQH
jgi:hypothetical protein